MFADRVEIIRQSAVEDSQVILTQGRTIVTSNPRYTVDFVPVPGNGILVKFTIANVTDEDEGMYICQARVHTDKGWEIQGNDSVNIRVLRALDDLLLKFDNNTAISKNVIDPIEVNSGVHTVICIAEGSNPAPTVNLYLNGSEVQIIHTMIDKWRPNLPRSARQLVEKYSLNLCI
uniref:Ig-like domain-containing protein n=1 Tax=Arion vulgaris TaxID=1028688 RepID=A0A0B7AGF7_9EUPU